MKRMLLVLIFVLAATPAVAAKRPTTSPALKKIVVATLLPSNTSFHNAIKKMGEEWRGASNGSIKLTIHPDGVKGSESSMVKRMRLGELDAAVLSVAGISEIDPGVTALQLMPMMFRDLSEVDFVRERMQPMLNERLRSKGFVVLFWADAGWVRFFSRNEAMTPADFRRVKLLTLAGDNRQIDLMKQLGYNPVPLEFSDALIALKTGMIDAVPTAPFHALAGQYYTVAKHMLQVNWVPLVGALVIRSQTWDALAPELQVAFVRAATEAGQSIEASGRSESDQAVAAMQKRGLVVHALTPAAQAEWERIARTAYPHIRGGMVPADVFDQVQGLLAARRNGKPAAGR